MQSTTSLVATSFASGLCGSMLLMGPGMILGPVLLTYKTDPQVTSATTIFIVLLGAISSALDYWIAGLLTVDYAAYFDCIAVLASVLGVSVIKFTVKRYGRTSVVVFLLSGIAAFSCVLVPVYDGITVYDSIQDGSFRGGFNFHCV